MKQMIHTIINTILLVSYYFFIIAMPIIIIACFISVGNFSIISDAVYDLLCKSLDFLKAHERTATIINIFFYFGCAAFVIQIMDFAFKCLTNFMTWFAEMRWR